jgi:hypothetical protein
MEVTEIVCRSLSCQVTVEGFREPEVSRIETFAKCLGFPKNPYPRPDLKIRSQAYGFLFFVISISALSVSGFFLSVFPLFFQSCFCFAYCLEKKIKFKNSKKSILCPSLSVLSCAYAKVSHYDFLT